ncbi:hypothetical protein [Paenibacillus hexagrammi]|uniref:Uncharacterized protein n=1 Tax=Paenibacillus hexagrammi TaxID=2908839 RepID=A0ABY3SID1_9BACL|nr:hypothetical protein [Paenibacillus sp. YPD9-1]UJF33802.1 hypothetical protein L0M14_00590 [Paenibacillus sp. YPD9-1]
MSEDKKTVEQDHKTEKVIEINDLEQELSNKEMQETKGGVTVNKGPRIPVSDYSKSRAARGRIG